MKNTAGTLKVEVKGTGKNAFQFLSQKDISAHYLVWVHFGNLFSLRKGDTVTVVTVDRPSQYFTRPQKIDLKRLRKSAHVKESKVSLNTI